LHLLDTLSPSSVDTALLITRIVLGAVFLAHGINHIIGGGKIAGTARWFEGLVKITVFAEVEECMVEITDMKCENGADFQKELSQSTLSEIGRVALECAYGDNNV
jgi:hypothetical protein